MRKRGKPIKQRYRRTPMILGSAMVFGPLHAIIDQIEADGTLTCDVRGRPMFQEPEKGMWCDTSEALKGLITHMEMYETRHKVTLPLESIRRFQRFVEHVMHIPESLLQALKRDMNVLQKVMALSDPDDALDLFQQCVIKEELEKKIADQN